MGHLGTASGESLGRRRPRGDPEGQEPEEEGWKPWVHRRSASPRNSNPLPHRGEAWLKGLEMPREALQTLQSSLQFHLAKGGFSEGGSMPMLGTARMSLSAAAAATAAAVAPVGPSSMGPGPPVPPIPTPLSLLGNSEDVRNLDAPTASDAELRRRLLSLAQSVATCDQV